MEPLAAAIRADPGVRGLLVPGSGGLRVKLSQYADDTTLLLDSDACLLRTLEIFQEFGRVSGAELNPAKSSVKFFGRWKGRTDVPGGLSLCSGPLRLLGVDFEAAHSATANWTRRLEAVRKKVALWKARPLTLTGKVLVLKADVLPSLLYLSYIFPMPASMRGPLTRLVFGFVWGGRCEYVARARMYAPIGEGGRGVPHLPLMLDCFFVSFLLRELSSPVVHPSGHFLRLFFSYQARRVMGVLGNLGPRSEQVPWHYGHAARWLRAHPEALEGGLGLDHKRLYVETRRGVTAPAVVGTPAAVWLAVQPPGLDNGLKDLNWSCLQKALPVRANLYRWGWTASPGCPRATCSGEETIHHVMWDCPFAGVVWARAGALLGRVRRGFTPTWASVERGVARGESRREGVLLWLLISLLKKGLWVARQDLIRLGRDCGVEGVLRRVEGDLRGRIKVDIERWGQHAALERWKGGLGLV